METASILCFIEDTFGLGRIGDQSIDAIAGDLGAMLDFTQRGERCLFLDPATREVVASEGD